MKLETWKQSTGKLPGLDAITALIGVYKQNRTDENLDAIDLAVRKLESETGKEAGGELNARIRELREWIDRRRKEESDSSFGHVQAAAVLVSRKYGAYMPNEYLEALRTVFIEAGNGVRRCYKYYSDKALFEKHIRTIEPTAPVEIVQHADGIAPTLSMTDVSTRNLAGETAPFNRRIEFRDPIKQHTLVHEMLHWSCHENFRLATLKQQLAKEGMTEWLAREVTGVSLGGWAEHHDNVRAAVRGGADTNKLLAAYFKGEDADTIEDYLKSFIAAGKKTGRLNELAQLATVANLSTKAPSDELRKNWRSQIKAAFDTDDECRTWVEQKVTNKRTATGTKHEIWKAWLVDVRNEQI